MFESIAAGLVLGLSNGIQCTVVCLPVLLTQLMSKKRTAADALKVSFLFSLGRLLVYFATSVVRSSPC
jgi:sulfite exporter TauE/SafE